MKKCICLSLLLSLTSINLTADRSGPIDAPHILIINAYHKGYNWTDEQSESALKAITARIPHATVDVIYLDWKRHPVPETIEDMSRSLRNKYSKKKIDLILTTDDAALSLALSLRNEFLSGAPVVFMGIFVSSDQRLTQGQTGVTGVYEAVDIEGTVRLALKVLPESRDIFIIHDESETSKTMEADINQVLDSMGVPLTRHVLGGYVFSDLLETLAAIPPDSIVLLASYARDPNNLTLQPEVFAELMSGRSAAPLFVLYSHMMGTGAAGGSLLDGRLQGEAAVELGVKILSGTQAENLPRITRKTVRQVLDYSILKRFGIESSNAPKGTLIINKPFSFFETYRDLVLATALVFLLLLTLVIILGVNIRKRYKTEMRLLKSNEEIAMLNRGLEQKVRARTSELSEANAKLEKALEEVQATREIYIQNEKLAAIGHLTAEIAHELNTPLGAMLASARTLARDMEMNKTYWQSNSQLTTEEFICRQKLMRLAWADPLFLAAKEERRKRKIMTQVLERAGHAAKGDQTAEKLVELGYEPEEGELEGWMRLERFSLLLDLAYSCHSAHQATWIISQSAQRAAAVVEAMRMHAYRGDGTASPVDVVAEIESVLTLFYGRMKHGIEVVRRFEPVGPALFQQDLLSQIWVNIIENALQAMNYRGTLTIAVKPDGEAVLVSISDTGRGIAPEIKDKIFTPFFTTKERGEGTGLGLDICKRNLEEWGGRIDFESSERGTTFNVWIPREHTA